MKTEILLEELKRQGKTLATAESCTGGGIGHRLTAIPGSSAAYAGGVISYTNHVKQQILGVPAEVLDTKGAVSAETAQAMAEGVRRVIGADLGISATGLAGPEGDGSGKPVGLVYLGAADGSRTVVRQFRFEGDREAVRSQAIEEALNLALNLLNDTAEAE